MALIEFENDSAPYINAENLNEIQKGNVYSTDEIEIGKWIDGKKIYRKVITTNNITGNNIEIEHGIFNLKRVIKFDAIASNDNGTAYPLNNKKYIIEINQINSTKIIVNINNAFSSGWPICYILEYTKTTD